VLPADEFCLYSTQFRHHPLLGRFAPDDECAIAPPFPAVRADLFVSSSFTNEVKRYDGATGAFVDNFVAASSGGLDVPWGVTFGPDRNTLRLRVSGNMGLNQPILFIIGYIDAFVFLFVAGLICAFVRRGISTL
jgi:hypothetical protein